MKIFVAISLSILIFFQSVCLNFSDLFLMKDLIEHAQFHSEEYGDDLFTFLQKHYGELKAEHLENNDKEDAQHEKLPFQHKHCTHLITEIIVLHFQIEIGAYVNYLTSHQSFHYENFYSFTEGPPLFQPPRLA